jgi:hypothetical protein
MHCGQFVDLAVSSIQPFSLLRQVFGLARDDCSRLEHPLRLSFERAFEGAGDVPSEGAVPTHHFFPCGDREPARSIKHLQEEVAWREHFRNLTETLYAWDSTGRHWRTARKELEEKNGVPIAAKPCRCLAGVLKECLRRGGHPPWPAYAQSATDTRTCK